VARGLGPKRDRSGDPATVYALHVPPERFINEVSNPVSDSYANTGEAVHGDTQGKDVAAYYRNEVEDRNSTSVVLNNRHPLLTHSDYVRDAIANGKEHEVHPTTLDMYHRGSLDKVEPINWDKVKRTKQTNYNPEAEKLAQHEGGLFPYEHRQPYSEWLNAGKTEASVTPVSREELASASGGGKQLANEMYQDRGSGLIGAAINAAVNDIDPEAKKFVDNTGQSFRVALTPVPKRVGLGDVTRNRSTKPKKKAPPAKYVPKKSAPPAP
jgi:hypothetical protein